MPTFQYQAQRSDGSYERGLVVGSSLDGAARDLAAKGLNVTHLSFAQSFDDPIPSDFQSPGSGSVAIQPPTTAAPRPEPVTVPRETPVAERPVPPSPSYGSAPLPDRSYFETSVAGPLVGQVPLTDLAFFFRNAATMLDAGVGIVQTMSTLAVQARNPKLASVIREIARQVEAGHSISETMKRYPEAIAPVVVSVLEAGERGGFLAEALATNADYLDQEIELRNLYKRATFYPKLQVGASIIIIIAANAIIASIKPDAQKLESPLTNPATWIVLTPLIVALFLFFRVGLANPNVRTGWDMAIIRIPYLGKTLQQIAMARFGRSFAALYKAGVPLQTILVLSANSCGNEHIKSLMLPAAAKLEQGYGITETLTETRAFSPMILDMVHTGETTGKLDYMLQKTADFYIEEAKIRQRQLGLTVGVAVSIMVCIYIGYIVINFYTGMGSSINQQMSSAG